LPSKSPRTAGGVEVTFVLALYEEPAYDSRRNLYFAFGMARSGIVAFEFDVPSNGRRNFT
jgi:hypothetical protein